MAAMLERYQSDEDGGRPFAQLLTTIRRMVVGIAWLALAIALAIAVWGFDPADPSFNTATSAAPVNPLDLFGAYTADLCLQLFGEAIWLPVLVFAAWGIRLLADKPFRHAGIAATSLPIALLALCAFLATQPQPDAASWPLRVGLGGFVGRFLFESLHYRIGGTLYGWLAVLLTLIPGIAAFGIQSVGNPRALSHLLPGHGRQNRTNEPEKPSARARTNEPERVRRPSRVAGLARSIFQRLAGAFRTNEPETRQRPRRVAVRKVAEPIVDDDTNEPERPPRGRGRAQALPDDLPPQPGSPDGDEAEAPEAAAGFAARIFARAASGAPARDATPPARLHERTRHLQPRCRSPAASNCPTCSS